MRLGAYPCRLKPKTLAAKVYQRRVINERHRHRYEVNNRFRAQIEKAGLVVSGLYPKKNLVEIIELSDHPFFIATQFHPEFLTRPVKPHPLFAALISAGIRNKK